MEHDAARPDEAYWPRALELQVGGTSLFTARGRKRIPFTYDQFSAQASRIFLESPLRSLGNGTAGHGTAGSCSLEELTLAITNAAVHQTFDWVRSKPFRGVHSSDGVYDHVQKKPVACDLSDPDERLRNLAIQKYKSVMTLAKVVEATSFVMHPSSVDSPNGQWLGMADKLQERRDRKQRFFESLNELLVYYKEQGFHFPIAIENLEFPKFPATNEEFTEFLTKGRTLAAAHGLPPETIGLCFDFQHMRHSYKIINEQQNWSQYNALRAISSKSAMEIEDLLPGFSHAGRAFVGVSYHPNWKAAIRRDPVDTADEVLNRVGSDIKVVHLAGNYFSDRMDYVSETQGNIPYIAQGAKIEPKALNVRRAIRMLLNQKVTPTIIIEDQTPGGMRGHLQSATAVERYISDES